MIEIGALAASAVAALAPYLVEGGKEFAKTVGKEAAGGGLRLLGWLRERLAGAGREALEDVEKAPGDEDTRGALRVQVRKLLEREPGLAGELEALVAAAREGAPAGVAQSVSQVGDGNVGANISGSGNSVSRDR